MYIQGWKVKDGVDASSLFKTLDVHKYIYHRSHNTADLLQTALRGLEPVEALRVSNVTYRLPRPTQLHTSLPFQTFFVNRTTPYFSPSLTQALSPPLSLPLALYLFLFLASSRCHSLFLILTFSTHIYICVVTARLLLFVMVLALPKTRNLFHFTHLAALD